MQAEQAYRAQSETQTMTSYEPNEQYQASQLKICTKVNQVKEACELLVDKKIIVVTIPYALEAGDECKQCLRMCVDMCADINIMP